MGFDELMGKAGKSDVTTEASLDKATDKAEAGVDGKNRQLAGTAGNETDLVPQAATAASGHMGGSRTVSRGHYGGVPFREDDEWIDAD